MDTMQAGNSLIAELEDAIQSGSKDRRIDILHLNHVPAELAARIIIVDFKALKRIAG
jgi:hypothetical protein